MQELTRTKLMVHESVESILSTIDFVQRILEVYADSYKVIAYFKEKGNFDVIPYKELREAIESDAKGDTAEALELELIRLSEIEYYLNLLFSTVTMSIMKIS